MSHLLGQTRLSFVRSWHVVNLAKDERSLGRLASQIAIVLMGKHKPIFDPASDCGDYVVATGCKDLRVTGKKLTGKLYYSHSTKPGSLKSLSMDKMMAKWGGGEVLRRAVRGMLPKNKLRNDRMARLKCFEGHAHPYERNTMKVKRGPLDPPPEVKLLEAAEQAQSTASAP